MSPAIGLSDAFGSFAQELYTRYLNEVQLSKELQPLEGTRTPNLLVGLNEVQLSKELQLDTPPGTPTHCLPQ